MSAFIPAADIAFARRGPNSDILVGRSGDKLVATALVGHDGHRGWVYYVAVDPDAQGSGFGRAIMSAAEDWLRTRGVLKVQLMVRPDNSKVQAFYEDARLRRAEAHHLRQVARWPSSHAVSFKT